MIEDVHALLIAGGWVSLPLGGVSLTMWFVATLRVLNLRRGFSGSVHSRVEHALEQPEAAQPRGSVDRYLAAALNALKRANCSQQHAERFLEVERERLTNYGVLLMGLVTVAPLLGLLGTVSGMIETFASMQGASLTHAAEQSVAGGISVALISTQLGLTVGVPGLVMARFLARFEARRLHELLQAHSVLMQLREVPQ